MPYIYHQPEVRKKLRDRAKRILAMDKGGATKSDIGRVLGISRQRVTMILLLIEKAKPGQLYYGLGG